MIPGEKNNFQTYISEIISEKENFIYHDGPWWSLLSTVSASFVLSFSLRKVHNSPLLLLPLFPSISPYSFSPQSLAPLPLRSSSDYSFWVIQVKLLIRGLSSPTQAVGTQNIALLAAVMGGRNKSQWAHLESWNFQELCSW